MVRHTKSCVLTDFKSCQVGTDCNLLLQYAGVGTQCVCSDMLGLVPSELCSISAGVGTQRASALIQQVVETF